MSNSSRQQALNEFAQELHDLLAQGDEQYSSPLTVELSLGTTPVINVEDEDGNQYEITIRRTK